MKFKPHHIAISVRNLSKSLEFYKTLGFEQVYRYDEDDSSMSIVHLKLENTYLEVFAYKENKNEPPVNYEYGNNLENVGVKHIALQTESIESTLSELKEKGLADKNTEISESDTKKAWWFFIKDPDGVWVEVIKDERY